MAPRRSVWYRLGFTLEKARSSLASNSHLRNPAPSRRREAPDVLRSLATVAGGTVASALLSGSRRRSGGLLAVVRAGTAGAGAALLQAAVRPLLQGSPRPPEPDEALAREVVAGAALGILYGTVVEPRLWGPAFVRGAVFGSVDYLASPWGGLPRLLKPMSPFRKLPLPDDLLEPKGRRHATYVDYVVFGVALALLYGSRDART